MDPIKSILVEDLSKRFRKQGLFQNISEDYKQGERIAVLGRNGSGKSTFLKIICGASSPTSGSVKWLNEKDNPVDLLDLHKNFSFSAPYLELMESFSLKELLDFHFSLKFRRDDIDLDKWLEETGLKGHKNKTVSQFSSGMNQRLKLILCLASDVPVYFLDEPCSNLDDAGTEWYQNKVRMIPKNRIIFIASNSPKEYEICSRFIKLDANLT